VAGVQTHDPPFVATIALEALQLLVEFVKFVARADEYLQNRSQGHHPRMNLKLANVLFVRTTGDRHD
jgi:hypothetical protein